MKTHYDHLAVPAHDLHNRERSPSPSSVFHRRLDLRPKKHLFVGVAVRERKDLDDKGPEYAISVSDGTGTVQSEHGFGEKGKSCEDTLDYILELSKKYSSQRGHKIQILSLAETCTGLTPRQTFDVPTLSKGQKPDFPTRVWLELDAIPFLASRRASEGQFSIDAQASAAVDEALACLVPMSSSTVKIMLSPVRQVLVDADFRVRLYGLPLLKQITSPALWNTFSGLGSALAAQKTSVAFFSATPRGGGVALMRHSLMRVWHATGLDVKWFVPAGDPSVFNITKRKFHNVLQGVAEPNIRLTSEDKELFEAWTQHNYERFWADAETSPFRRLDVAVIDDPQLTALIPIIRRESPRTKIIFRSHIQIRADLVDNGDEQIRATWDYLWGYTKQADLFVSHPIKEFVPEEVKQAIPVVYLPPSTDPIDGLNKPIKRGFLHMYRKTFDDAVQSSSGDQVDWDRGYVLQVARFDPSKGIPDLVEGYRLFREQVEKDGRKLSHAPQLILTGHSSVDDPDGTLVLHQLHDQLEGEKFEKIRDDIHAIRAPPSDRLLNAILRGADVVCQVSTREGYEIKVTEAVHKGSFVIATKAGGIPLQIREGREGELVDPGDAEGGSARLVSFLLHLDEADMGIAKALLSFYSSDKLKVTKSETPQNYIDDVKGGRFSHDDAGPSERDLTLGNAVMWQLIWARLLGVSSHIHLSQEQKTLFDKLRVASDDQPGGLEGLVGKRAWEEGLDKGF
ncbi:hypothetical protein JCM11641_004945 [Rhodosporidiobolus odoratus]